MSERSLFNVACKLLGLWLFFHAAAAFVWAFLVGRFDHTYSVFDPDEDLGWSSGAVWLVAGAFLCFRSGWLTQLIYRIDPPLDIESNSEPATRLMTGMAETRLEDAARTKRDPTGGLADES